MVQALKRKMKSEKGFTLIELLAVIVILGIIAAIAIPSITHIIEKSRADAVKADAKMILNAAKLYQTEHTIPTDGITATQLEAGTTPYVEHVTTFPAVADTGHYVVQVSGNQLVITGVGTKGNVSVTFSSTALDGIDALTYTTN